MRVLGLLASPRKLGNSEILIKEMLNSLPEDCEKEIIRLTDLEIKMCNACYACVPKEKNCVLQDDFNFVLEKIKKADAIVIVSPCYFLGAHTIIKKIKDRLLSVVENREDFAGKKCVTVAVHGLPGWSGYAREELRNFAHFLHLDVVGSLVIQAANPGEVVEEEIISKVRSLTQKIVNQNDYEDSEEQKLLTCPSCQSTVLQISVENEAYCVMCGTKGKIKSREGKSKIEIVPTGFYRFSEEGMKEHAENLNRIKGQFIKLRKEFKKKTDPYSSYNWWTEPER